MTNRIYPLGDRIGYIELIDTMGTDLDIVNDARVSYDRESFMLTARDRRLIDFLIRENHTSPLRGCVVKFQVKCPIYIARQWWKHHVSSNHTEDQDGWNEKSLRYATVSPSDYFLPNELPLQDPNNKQASLPNEFLADGLRIKLTAQYRTNVERCIDTYNQLIEAGVSREIARGVLPACVYTKFRWTVSLHGFLNFLILRKGEGAQSEIQKYADAAEGLVKPYFEHTMMVWSKYNK